jgi:predicted Zn-ribbon and HTH transcriptional regulator
MDLGTGDIREIEDIADAKAAEVELEHQPKPGCKSCFGRGYHTQVIRIKVPCKCTGVDTKSDSYIRAQAANIGRLLME